MKMVGMIYKSYSISSCWFFIFASFEFVFTRTFDVSVVFFFLDKFVIDVAENYS